MAPECILMKRMAVDLRLCSILNFGQRIGSRASVRISNCRKIGDECSITQSESTAVDTVMATETEFAYALV
jgi:hypothetical protein